VAALVGKVPLQPEIPFGSGFGILRNDGNEQPAFVDLPANLVIPGISASQFALVEPHRDPRGTQYLADALCRRRILGGIAQEYGLDGFGHGTRYDGTP
jgi:hypothetical protein